MADRKRSALANHTNNLWGGEQPTPQEQDAAPVRAVPDPVTAVPRAGSATGRRRKRKHDVVDELDMKSFNCNMTVAARRAVGRCAADNDVDKQDVIEAALVEFFAKRGVTVPTRPGAPTI